MTRSIRMSPKAARSFWGQLHVIPIKSKAGTQRVFPSYRELEYLVSCAKRDSTHIELLPGFRCGIFVFSRSQVGSVHRELVDPSRVEQLHRVLYVISSGSGNVESDRDVVSHLRAIQGRPVSIREARPGKRSLGPR